MEWTEELSLKLIECYRQNPILWDPTDGQFKLSKRKIDIWKTIAAEFKCEESEAKKKIESLLTSYRREMKREGTVRSGMGTEDTYHSKWFAFKSMQFLNDKFRPRKTHNTEKESAYVDDTQESQGDDESTEPQENEDDEVTIQQVSSTPAVPDHENSSCSSTSLISNRNLSTENKYNFYKPTSSKVAAKRREPEDPRIEAAFAVIQNLGDKRAKKNEKNECVLYGEYVGSQLEKFDDHTRAVVKHEIANILFKAEMGTYQTQQTLQWSNSSTPSYVPSPLPSPGTYFGGHQNQQQYTNNTWTIPRTSIAPSSAQYLINPPNENETGSAEYSPPTIQNI